MLVRQYIRSLAASAFVAREADALIGAFLSPLRFC